MPPVVTFQGVVHPCESVDEFGVALDAFDLEPQFELWLNEPKGPAVCMLRNGGDAWLMYLRHEGDSGFTSLGDTRRSGAVSYRLSNGQTDDYPAAWCVPVENCYKALAYFFVNRGLRPEWLAWRES
jgi:Immunity protein Imm1